MPAMMQACDAKLDPICWGVFVRKQETTAQQVLQKSNAQNLQAPVDSIITLK
jgi:hypothetical protein